MASKTIKHLYVEEKMDIGAIALKKKMHYFDVWQKLLDADVQIRRPQGTKTVNADWLHMAYWEDERKLEDIADDCGVSVATIMNWMEGFGILRRPTGVTGENHGSAKLNSEAVNFIRQLYAANVSPRIIRERLAEEHQIDVDRRAIWNVVTGRSWKEVPA